MKTNVPAGRPRIEKDAVAAYLKAYSLEDYAVKLLGIRGYYRETMGAPGKNDRGIYDDAIFLFSPTCFVAFNANTDPSKYKPGIATLKAGAIYLYKVGLHNMEAPYEALRQYGRVTVLRDGQGEDRDTASHAFYINIHKGGYTTTSSLGCQTIYPSQWQEFMGLIKTELKKYGQVILPYALIENDR